MSASGARVLSLRSVEFARNHGVKLHVRSTFTDDDGTWIREEDERMLEKAMISGVTHTLEEAVYEVKDADRADLRSSRRRGHPASADRRDEPRDRLPAPTEDRTETTAALERLGAQWSAREGLGKVSLITAGEKSTGDRRAVRALRELGVDASSWPPRPSRSPSTSPKGRSSARSRRCTRRLSLLGKRGATARVTRIGVIGATGAVGTVALELWPSAGSTTCARSPPPARRAGLRYGERELEVEEATAEASSRRSRSLLLLRGHRGEPRARPASPRGGAVSIDKSDAYRLAQGVPLVVAGVNDDALDHDEIVANPNCSAIQLACVLKPIEDAVEIARSSRRDLPVGFGRRRRGDRPATRHGRGRDRPCDGLGPRRRRVQRGGEDPPRDLRKIMSLPDLPLGQLRARAGHGRAHKQCGWRRRSR